VEPPLIPAWPDAAQALGVGRSRLWKLMLSGEIANTINGKKRMVSVASLNKYVEHRLAESTPAAS
jgi:hypothetical protein